MIQGIYQELSHWDYLSLYSQLSYRSCQQVRGFVVRYPYR